MELLFDDLLDWNNWFHDNRRLAPLNITCLGSAEGDMQDARFESGLDNSPMYDAGSCVNGTCGDGAGGGWACTSGAGLAGSKSSPGAGAAKGGKGGRGEETCGCFKAERMQLYDVGMASMHAMDCGALAALAASINRTAEAEMLRVRGGAMSALIEVGRAGAMTTRVDQDHPTSS